MHRALALVLAVTLPCTAIAQQRPRLLPREVPSAPPLVAAEPDEGIHLYRRWWFWTAVGATTVAAVTAIVAGVVASQRPQMKQADFPCAGSCDGWINQPPR
jgi:hypothetical protein